jgi:hypothetical protein
MVRRASDACPTTSAIPRYFDREVDFVAFFFLLPPAIASATSATDEATTEAVLAALETFAATRVAFFAPLALVDFFFFFFAGMFLRPILNGT